MSEESTLEQRVAALEKTVAELRQQLANGCSGLDFARQVPARLKDNPALEETLAHGRAFRWSDRPAEEGEDKP